MSKTLRQRFNKFIGIEKDETIKVRFYSILVFYILLLLIYVVLQYISIGKIPLNWLQLNPEFLYELFSIIAVGFLFTIVSHFISSEFNKKEYKWFIGFIIFTSLLSLLTFYISFIHYKMDSYKHDIQVPQDVKAIKEIIQSGN